MVTQRIRWALGLGSVFGLVAVGLSAQSGPSAQALGGPTLEALLAEVRGLRAELNQASSASIRTQLLTARLQLQEQRIYTVARQLTEVQGLLATVRDEMLDVQRRADNYERALASGEVPAAQQDDLRRAIPHERELVEQKREREQGLRTQETELLNTLNAEQARWTEFNGRLDEIERSLGATAR
jgi:chromosome segregation ATPase